MSVKKILLVEDSPHLSKTIVNVLTDEGFVVVSAMDGIEALKSLNEHPDLIWLDLYLPNMDGLEFLERLKKMPEYAKIPIIVATVSKNMEEIASGTEGANVIKTFIKSEVPLETIVAEIKNFEKNEQ